MILWPATQLEKNIGSNLSLVCVFPAGYSGSAQVGLPVPSPSAMLKAAAVALATRQRKLVAFAPSVPNLGSVEAARFLFLFVIY